MARAGFAINALAVHLPTLSYSRASCSRQPTVPRFPPAMSTSPPASAPSEDGASLKLGLNVADAWSAAAQTYIENFQGHVDLNKPFIDMGLGRKLIVSRVVSFAADKEKPVILDVAAAGGEPALSMAKEMPHATVYGTDFAAGMVAEIRHRADNAGVSNLKTNVEDGMALAGFEDASVDVVTCTWGLESMPDPHKAIDQFWRVLKPDGMAIFAAWDKDPNSIACKMFGLVSTLTSGKSMDIQPLGGDASQNAMQQSGFTGVTASRVPIPLYVPPGVGLRGLLPFMVKSTPVNAVLAALEKQGRPNIRGELAEAFEDQVRSDIENGCPPTGPGLPNADNVSAGAKEGVQPAFIMNAVVAQGFKKA